MTRLPVWATVTEAYRAVWQHRWLLLRFAAIPFLLILAIELAGAIPGQDYGVLISFFLLVEAAVLAAVTVIAYAILTGYPAEGVRVPEAPA